MKLMNLIWVCGLAGAVAGCNSGDALQGCSEFNEISGLCGGGTPPATGGTNGGGGTGGGGEGACTNAEDMAVYDALEYDTGSETLTGNEAASQIASDCVFGNQSSTPRNPGCGQQAQAVLICGGVNCDDATIQALTDCVLMCQATVIADATGGEMLSQECSGCYGASVTCSAVNCATAGCTVPDSATCIACRCDPAKGACTPNFDQCSGLPSEGNCG